MSAGRAQVRLVVHLEVEPREGQSPEQAADELVKAVAEYFTEDDKPFFEDYGARAADLEAFRADGDSPSWGGYEGPFVTRASVARADNPSSPHHLVAESDW